MTNHNDLKIKIVTFLIKNKSTKIIMIIIRIITIKILIMIIMIIKNNNYNNVDIYNTNLLNL